VTCPCTFQGEYEIFRGEYEIFRRKYETVQRKYENFQVKICSIFWVKIMPI
jgi:hypothetical protein